MTYLLVVLGILVLPFLAQLYITSTYKKYLKVTSKKNISGFETARKILDANGLNDIHIVSTPGTLTDHYDPSRNVIRLSTDIFDKNTISSVSVAAHECGHALQDKEGYFFLRFRRSILPFVNFASMAGYIAIMIGIFDGALRIFWFGIFCEDFILIFQLITLTVEFDASRRGLNELLDLGIVDSRELSNCKGMLTAAALTYVAAVATSLLEILRLVLMARRRD